MKPFVITVTGAAGQIAYSLLFRICNGEFNSFISKDRQIQLNLLEIEPALDKLKGVVMEIDDCAFPNIYNIIQTSDVNVAFKDCDLALLVGSFPRLKGMERSDLLEKNAHIFKTQGKALNEHASKDVKVLVIGNPCNTNALIAMKNARDIPKNRFFAMTLLDEHRAKHQIAEKLDVKVDYIHSLSIYGNHSSTMYPDFYNTLVNVDDKLESITDKISEEWLKTEFIKGVQTRGAQIINARGLSSAASAAHSIVRTVQELYKENSDESFSVALYGSGIYDTPKDLIISFPCKKINGELCIIGNMHHNLYAKEKIKASCEELETEYNIVKELGYI